MSKCLIHIHLKSLQSLTSSNNQAMSLGNVSVEYLILMGNLVIFEMWVPFIEFSLCKTNEKF